MQAAAFALAPPLSACLLTAPSAAMLCAVSFFAIQLPPVPALHSAPPHCSRNGRPRNAVVPATRRDFRSFVRANQLPAVFFRNEFNMYTREQVEARVKELGRVITEHYKPLLGGQPLIVVAILKGSFMFFSDLVKELDVDLTTEFMILKVC